MQYYEYKRGRMQVVSGYMQTESQALLTDYVRRTGLRQHLAASAAYPITQVEHQRRAWRPIAGANLARMSKVQVDWYIDTN